jgi:hypothetical protein
MPQSGQSGAVKLDMSTFEPLNEQPVTLDMSTFQPITTMRPGTYQSRPGGPLLHANDPAWKELFRGAMRSAGISPESVEQAPTLGAAFRTGLGQAAQSYWDTIKGETGRYFGAYPPLSRPEMMLLYPFHMMARGIEGIASTAEEGAQDIETGIKRRDPRSIAAGVGSLIGTKAQLGAAETSGEMTGETAKGAAKVKYAVRQAMEPRRIRTGPENILRALDTPPGKGGVRAAKMARDVDIAKADIAELHRTKPIKARGSEAFGKMAENIREYRWKLWKEAHEPLIERHARVPIDHVKLLESGLAEVTQEAADEAPAEADAALKWLIGSIDKPRTLASADKLLREINNNLKGKNIERYGPLQVRVRHAVASALREEIDRVLEQAGEKGVRDVNRRFGALRNIEERLAERGIQEWRKESKKGPIPDWAHLYLFSHPGLGVPMSVGAAIRVGSMLKPSPARLLKKGIRQLGKTSLSPEMPSMPEGRGRPPVGSLPAPATPPPAPGPPGTSIPQSTPPLAPSVPPEVISELSRIAGRQLEPHEAVALLQRLRERGLI